MMYNVKIGEQKMRRYQQRNYSFPPITMGLIFRWLIMIIIISVICRLIGLIGLIIAAIVIGLYLYGLPKMRRKMTDHRINNSPKVDRKDLIDLD